MYNVTQLTNYRQNTYQLNIKMNTELINVKRGDFVEVDLDQMIKPNKAYSFQQGKRPCIVLQNNTGNFYSPTVMIAIITKQNKNKLPTHVSVSKECGLKYDSIISIEQIFTVDKRMIIRIFSKCPDEIMRRVEIAEMIQFGICNRNKIYELADKINRIDERAREIGYDIEDAEYRMKLLNELKLYCEQYNCDYLEMLNNEENNIKYRKVI